MCTNTTFSQFSDHDFHMLHASIQKFVIIIFLSFAYINIIPFISAYISQIISFIRSHVPAIKQKNIFRINFFYCVWHIFWFSIKLYTAVQSHFLQWHNFYNTWDVIDLCLILFHTMAFDRLISHSFISVYEWEKVGCCNVDLLWRKETAYRLRFIRRRMPICLTEENNVFRVKSAHDGRG